MKRLLKDGEPVSGQDLAGDMDPVYAAGCPTIRDFVDFVEETGGFEHDGHTYTYDEPEET